jgi:hypothetical protein
VDPRAEAFEALEAVQRECLVYVADHCESRGSEGVRGQVGGVGSADHERVWQQALAHALGAKEWWDRYYRDATARRCHTEPLCFEVRQRTLGAYAAVSFTAVSEMQRQQVERRLFGAVTRPEAPSAAWAALSAIGQEVRRAVRDGRCPDDTEAFNAWSVVSFYVLNTRGGIEGVEDPVAENPLRRRDLVVFSLPWQLAERTRPDGTDEAPDRDTPADEFVAGRFAGSRWMRARKHPRLRGA